MTTPFEMPTLEALKADVRETAFAELHRRGVDNLAPDACALFEHLSDIVAENMHAKYVQLRPVFDAINAAQRAASPDTATNEQLDAIVGLSVLGEVNQRQTSNEHSNETPLWNDRWGWWEETDAQLRARRKAELVRGFQNEYQQRPVPIDPEDES